MIESIKKKYDKTILKNLDKENFKAIVNFLVKQKCNYIEDIIYNYLDLFNFDSIEFICKFNTLNKKYNGKFLDKASEDMNLLEEFYKI